MSQEFTIKSEKIESKINQLLPSQGGFGAGVDISASTMVIPIVDLTETAAGSSLRVDLQTSLGFGTNFTNVNNTTSTLVTTTGFYRVFGTSVRGNVSPSTSLIFIDDGTTQKTVFSNSYTTNSTTVPPSTTVFDFIVYLRSGDSLKATSSSNLNDINVTTRQIADLQGNLVNPLGFV